MNGCNIIQRLFGSQTLIFFSVFWSSFAVSQSSHLFLDMFLVISDDRDVLANVRDEKKDVGSVPEHEESNGDGQNANDEEEEVGVIDKPDLLFVRHFEIDIFRDGFGGN